MKIRSISRWMALMLAVLSASCSASKSDSSDAQVVPLEIASFAVDAGAQGLKCQNFANPFGRDIEVASWAAHLKAGAHHLTVYLAKGIVDGPLHDCGGNEGIQAGGGLIFQGQQTGESSLVYPDGLTTVIPKDYGFALEFHYVNASERPETIENRFEMTLPASPAKSHVAGIFVNASDIHVPPHGNGSVQRNCTFDHDVQLVWLTSHMHTHGLEFKAALGSQALVDTQLWDGPPVHVFSPPLTVPAGQPLTVSCQYANATDHELTFGISIYDSEMCILPGGYVTTESAPVTLVCNEDVVDPNKCLTCGNALMMGRARDACTNDGPPSSADKFTALNECTCKTNCAQECGDNICAGAGHVPSTACTNCTSTKCTAQGAACFGRH